MDLKGKTASSLAPRDLPDKDAGVPNTASPTQAIAGRQKMDNDWQGMGSQFPGKSILCRHDA
jgi:hypothetical protein